MAPALRGQLSRVCVVSALYHPSLGGLGRQAQILSERLRSDGIELFVIARRMDGMPPARFAPDVEVLRVATPWPRVHILEETSPRNLVISLAFSLGCLALLVRHRRRYDIVHFHGASLPLFVGLPALKLMGKRVVAKVAAANLGTEAGGLQGRWAGMGTLLSRLARRVDAFVAISDEIRVGLLSDGVAPERIHRISNFVDTELFQPAGPEEKDQLKARFGYAGQRLVLFAGRLVPRKGADVLLRAWARLSPEFSDARLVLLGEGPLGGTLEQLAGRLGISATVRFGGTVGNMPDWLRAADVFVLPSLQEGLPNALLEAMAAGLPCLATRIGGVVDIVRQGVNAMLTDPEDTEGLAAALGCLLADPVLAAKLATGARETIESKYAVASQVLAYRNLYEVLAAGMSKAPAQP